MFFLFKKSHKENEYFFNKNSGIDCEMDMSLWQLSRENSEDQLTCMFSSAELGPALVGLVGVWALTLLWVWEVDV